MAWVFHVIEHLLRVEMVRGEKVDPSPRHSTICGFVLGRHQVAGAIARAQPHGSYHVELFIHLRFGGPVFVGEGVEVWGTPGIFWLLLLVAQGLSQSFLYLALI